MARVAFVIPGEHIHPQRLDALPDLFQRYTLTHTLEGFNNFLAQTEFQPGFRGGIPGSFGGSKSIQQGLEAHRANAFHQIKAHPIHAGV